MKILVVGGAGYIGSHMVKELQEKNYEVIVLDDLSTGHDFLISNCHLIKLSLLDKTSLISAIKSESFDAVCHFAAKSLVGESNKNPSKYYENNLIGTFNLLEAMKVSNINKLVFSSTAAIFGNPKSVQRISETHQTNPINVYGKTKLMIEKMIEDYCNSYNLSAVCLRYFNAAGAHPSGTIGEFHEPETHLIPNIINYSLGKSNKFTVFGHDYDTPDGTCIRDYVYIMDLIDAHIKSLEYMQNNIGFKAFNLGSENGFSVMDVIKACESTLRKKIKYDIGQKRSGDPSILIADSSNAKKFLNWEAKVKSLNFIVETAYNWHIGNSKETKL